VLKIWEGGLSFVGGPLFAFAYLWWFCRKHNLSFLAFADICAPGFALGHAFGRVGCFLGGCCYGRECDLPWAIRFHPNGDIALLTPPSHPTQLYASVACLIIFFRLNSSQRRPHRPGEILLSYLILYGCWRFVEESLRRGATADVFCFGFTHMQVACLAAEPCCCCGCGAYAALRSRRL